MSSDYAQRVHRVVDHIRGHLDKDLSLHQLAKVAHFSPFHFHRIFKAVQGETVAEFTRRARLERATYLMRGAPARPLSSIALEVGFGTPSEFSRVFRARYGCPPSSWDRTSRLEDKESVLSAKISAAVAERPSQTARVVDRPACKLIYVRVTDPWQSTHLAQGYTRLTEWLKEQGFDWRNAALLGLSWDSDKATPLSQLRYDLGFVVGDDIEPKGDFGLHHLPKMRAVEVHCQSLLETAFAWDYLYEEWFPNSRYEPRDLPALKRFTRPPLRLEPAAWNVNCSIGLRDRLP